MPQPIKDAWTRLKVWLAHYFFGMFAFAFNNATTTLDGVVGLAVGAAVTPDISAPTWKTGLAIFGTTFARSVITYFAQHPIPTKLPTNETQAPFAK